MIDQTAILEKARILTQSIYRDVPYELPFHGWHHIEFVHKQALRFAHELGADPFLVALAAYVHDLNYIAKKSSTVKDGLQLRRKTLEQTGLSDVIIDAVEQIVTQTETAVRINHDLNPEAKALSDADTLFKALPIAPVLFARLYIEEQNSSFPKLAKMITEAQQPLYDQDMYFFSESAKKYLPWAKANLDIWHNVVDYLNDPDVAVDLTSINSINKLF